ncbi:MAG TPA: hypothetical protein P5234_01980 [Thermoanaerobaculaceae bacterium]|nr:hypothetical protein [Thermoanaerobaculaceae bacterium]HRS14997.1 hypothetical protein [Thermoanaerobaculaceae bacterium]
MCEAFGVATGMSAAVSAAGVSGDVSAILAGVTPSFVSQTASQLTAAVRS